MMSERIYLNNDWKFAEQFEASMTEAAYDDSVMQNVRLPHTCKETPLHYFDEHCYQMVSGYRRVIEAEEAWKGKKILLTIDGAAHEQRSIFKWGESGRTSLWIHSFYDGYQRSTPLWRKKISLS